MSFRSAFSKPLPRILAVLVLFAAVVGTTITTQVVTATKAHADGCYTWGRTLSQGTSGEDVRQLQIRVAGYPGYGGHLATDGAFGPATKAAVTRFQQAYGLAADGIAGPATFSKIYSLQDDDCTPIHFTYSELDDGCGGSGWDGGPLSAAATKANALQTMWQLEAMRHAMGDAPHHQRLPQHLLQQLGRWREQQPAPVRPGGRPGRLAHALPPRPAGPEPRLRRHLRPRLPGPQRPHPPRHPYQQLLVRAQLRDLIGLLAQLVPRTS